MSKPKIIPFSLGETRALPQDEVESARILLREGLVEEAKKTLYKVLAHKSAYRPALLLLKEIESIELKDLFQDTPQSTSMNATSIEDIDALIELLDRDLGLGLKLENQSPQKEIWNATGAQDLNAQARFDLGVAFYEMGCFADALRELYRAEKRIRIEETFLGKIGLASASLIAQCLVNLGRAFEAKTYLEPVLIEPDLKHEDKLGLYYVMALAEQALDQPKNALAWYQKINATDSEFRDVQIRIRQLSKS